MTSQNVFYLLLFIATGSIITFFFTSFSPVHYSNSQPPIIFGEWESMGGGTSGGAVLTLATDRRGNLYVGGYFDFAGGENNRNIAKWKSGNQWAYYNNLSAGFDDDVYSLVVNKDDEIFAVGRFEKYGNLGEDLHHIATSLTTNIFASWEGLSGGVTTSYSHAKLVTDIFGNIYFTGFSGVAADPSIHGVAKWDGEHWSDFCGEGDNNITLMATDRNGTLYATTTNDDVIWCNGEQWDTLGAANHIINDIAIDTAGNVIIVGSFSQIANITAPGIAKWNGESWEAINTVTNLSSHSIVEIDGNNNIYASKLIAGTDGFLHFVVERWDGNTWQQLGSSLNSFINDMAIDTFGNFYVGGDFDNLDLNQVAKFSEKVKPFPTYPSPDVVSTDILPKRKPIKIYPNPANSTLHIMGLENVSTDITVLNSQGITVSNVPKGKNHIDISNLPNGLYFLRVKQEKGEQVLRFIKE